MHVAGEPCMHVAGEPCMSGTRRQQCTQAGCIMPTHCSIQAGCIMPTHCSIQAGCDALHTRTHRFPELKMPYCLLLLFVFALVLVSWAILGAVEGEGFAECVRTWCLQAAREALLHGFHETPKAPET